MIFLVNPLHYALHHDRRWRFAETFPFLASRAFLPVARSEVRALAAVGPLAIQRIGELSQVVLLIDRAWCRKGVFSPDMHWLGGLPPLAVRYHPFQILEDGSGNRQAILGVAADPTCVSRGEGEPFFDHVAQPLPRVRAVYRRLRQIDREMRQINQAAASLVALGVTRPLPIVDSRGRALFETVNLQAFERLAGASIVEGSQRPQDIVLLAAALDHSGRRHLAPFGEEGDVPGETLPLPVEAPPARSDPSFLIDDDLVMSFQ
jgi:hypothetical protein